MTERTLITHVVLKLTAILTYGLFVFIDGLRSADSFDARFLTLALMIGGFALVCAFSDALNSQHYGHAFLFSIGLFSLTGM